MISVWTVDFEEQSMPEMISGNTDAHAKCNAHQCNYFHCSEIFRAMRFIAPGAWQSVDFLLVFITSFHMDEADSWIPNLYLRCSATLLSRTSLKKCWWSTLTFNLHWNFVCIKWVFVFPGPGPGPGPSARPQPWAPICICRPWPPICTCRPWPAICIYRSWPKIGI